MEFVSSYWTLLVHLPAGRMCEGALVSYGSAYVFREPREDCLELTWRLDWARKIWGLRAYVARPDRRPQPIGHRGAAAWVMQGCGCDAGLWPHAPHSCNDSRGVT
eukprot:scaffold7005_cov28-Tisochrysis_lutea.AAC.3